jgi:hypothetical protein
MPQIRTYRRFGFVFLLEGVAGVALLLPVFVFLWARASDDRFDAWFWIATAVFVLGAGGGLLRQAARLRRMLCPQCGNLIVRTDYPPVRHPINFVCTRCDVEWVTGLHVTDD